MATADCCKLSCNVCGHDHFTDLGPRCDGVHILRCDRCHMGVLKNIPNNLSVFYTDDYYGGEGQVGYSDYALMAEHGVAWAAALVKCLIPSGRVLDIGCVDGYLLRKLGPGYELFGIEVNEAMGRRAAESGVDVIGRDLFADEILRNHAGHFDVVTSIAVFEHLRDFKAGFATALVLLKKDGVLLFEVPLLSETRDNKVWFRSSLEHVYYPTESGIRRLVEDELGLHLVGREIYVRDYASTYVGLVAKDPIIAENVAGLFHRLTRPDGAPRNAEERQARLQLFLVHAATSSDFLVADLDLLPAAAFTPPLVRRLQQIWTTDIRRLEHVTASLTAEEKHVQQLTEARDWHGLETRQLRVTYDELKSCLDRVQSDQAFLLKAAENEHSQAQLTLIMTRLERAEAGIELARSEASEALVASQAQNDGLVAEVSALQGRLYEALQGHESEVERLKADILTRLERAEAEIELARSEASEALVASQAQNDGLIAEVSALEGQLHEALQGQEELKSRRWEVERLEADIAALVQDRQLNVAQMVQGMVGAEARYQAALQTATSLEEEREALWSQLQAVLNSSSWKASLPFQQFGRRHPRVAQSLRRVIKAGWRTLGMRSWLSETIHQRDDNLAALRQTNAAQALAPLTLSHGPGALVRTTSSFAADAQEPTNAYIWPLDRPLVSVIIPCFNYGHFVAEAIESVLGQTFTDVEIVVVEGGSSSLESRGRLAELSYPLTRVLLQDSANRAGENRNFGIRHARGKYICCLDADDRLDPTYLEKTTFLMEHYEYDVVSTALRFFGDRSDACGIIERPVLGDLLEANHVLTCAIFRRELWKQAGGFHDFSEPEGHVHEDWAFWMRLAALGARFWNISGEYLFHYRSHGDSLSRKNVIPTERQAVLIQAFNADVLRPGVIERSNHLAAEERSPRQPLRNLVRYGLDSDRRTSDRRTVLIALPFTIIGGAERLLSSIVRHLSTKGWHVIVVTTVPVGEEHGDTTDWFRESTNEIYHLPRFLAPGRWSDFVRYIFEAKQVDLLWMVGSTYFYDMIPDLKALYPRLKIVDLLFNTVGHTGNNRKHAQAIDLNIVENREVLAWLVDRGEAVNRVKIIESGVDLSSHAPRPKDRGILERLGISESTLIVGFSGRWSDEKDPVGFVEIARRTQAVDVAFVMTGTGHMRPQIEAAIAAANFPQGRFNLLGPVPDITPYVSSYDVLCLPSRFDGRPVVVLEALAMGVPVIVSRVGALPEIVEDGLNGYLVDAGDYDGFAERLAHLAACRDKLQDLKHQARLTAERKLDARVMLAEYEAALSSALGETVRSAPSVIKGRLDRMKRNSWSPRRSAAT